MRVLPCLCLLACALAGPAAAISGCGGDSDSGSNDPGLDAAIDGIDERQKELEAAPSATIPEAAADATGGPATTEEPDATESTAPPPPPAARPVSRALLSSADRASFAKLAETLPGEEGVAVTTLGRGGKVLRFGTLRTGVAWSTAKVPVAMAAISAGVADEQDLVQAITASDNAAAERLWSALGEGEQAAQAATAQLDEAGDERTEIQPQRLRSGYTAFGQTSWALTDQARFVAGMGCAGSGPDVLKLMGRVVSGQRWGLGATGKPAKFKAGWGPGVSAGQGDGWLDRQMGIVTIGGRPVAVAMGTTAADHATGTQNLTAIAQWVVSHVDAKGAPRSARC